ncbi:MAG: lysophospholipid acyltransferase family protein [bacterium]|nr:lysophospholipid acyltransferase family protein [bacterium]
MHIEAKDILTYPKYVFRTIWQFVSNPRAWRNVKVIIWSLLRTIIVGRRLVGVIVSHTAFLSRKGTVTIPWTRKTLSRYNWRVAHKFWAPQILSYAKISFRVSGYDEIDWKKTYVLASNHQSTIDILILVKLIESGVVVVKEGALWLPYIGKISKYTQIVVDRKNKKQAVRAVKWGVRQYPKQNFVFFPEGTRSKTGNIGAFKKGAAATAISTGLPLIPIAIVGTHNALPTGSLLQLKLKPPPIKVFFRKPISTNGLNEKDVDMLNNLLFETVKKTLEENSD